MSVIPNADRDIEQACVRYARALDTRDWQLLDTVFDTAVSAQYGDQPENHGRAAVVASIRAFLDACGPSQHLLGNFDIAVIGTTGRSTCYVRVFHQGKGSRAHLTQETLGTYHAEWHHTTNGWRATKWKLAVSMELGTREAFGS